MLQTIALPLGYSAVKSGLRGSNSLPPPWQGGALPDELNPQMATRMRLELTTSAMTGRRSNQLNYRAIYGNNRARTYDPLLVRQMLSQLSYAPILLSSVFRRRYLLYYIARRLSIPFLNFFYFFRLKIIAKVSVITYNRIKETLV